MMHAAENHFGHLQFTTTANFVEWVRADQRTRIKDSGVMMKNAVP
jgi:hypothetical protein